MIVRDVPKRAPPDSAPDSSRGYLARSVFLSFEKVYMYRTLCAFPLGARVKGQHTTHHSGPFIKRPQSKKRTAI